jgi:hypothetical protein
MTEPEPQPAVLKAKRRRFQYSLRTLLLLVYVGGPCLGWVGIAAKDYVLDYFWPPSPVEQAPRWLSEHQGPGWPESYVRRCRSPGIGNGNSASKEATGTCAIDLLPFYKPAERNGASPSTPDEPQDPAAPERSDVDGCPPWPVNQPDEGTPAWPHPPLGIGQSGARILHGRTHARSASEGATTTYPRLRFGLVWRTERPRCQGRELSEPNGSTPPLPGL